MSVCIITAKPQASASQTDPKNYFLNSNWDWNPGDALSYTIGPTTGSYTGSTWFCKNNGTAGGNVSTFEQDISAAYVVPGAQGYLQATISGSAITGYVDSPFEVIQPLEHQTSLELDAQNASAGFWVLAEGNVTQVGIQFLYEASEIMPTNTVGSEVLVTVNSGTYTFVKTEGVSLPSLGSAGVYGCRIRPRAVSSGDLGDVGNGFFLAKAQWNPGGTLSPVYQRAGATVGGELLLINRLIRKSYRNINTAGSGAAPGNSIVFLSASTVAAFGSLRFDPEMRVTPTVTLYSYYNGTLGAVSDVLSTADITGTTDFGTAQNGFFAVQNLGAGFTAGNLVMFHYVADARIY